MRDKEQETLRPYVSANNLIPEFTSYAILLGPLFVGSLFAIFRNEET